MHLAFSKAQTEELLVPLKASRITLGIVIKFVQHISHDKHACINFNIHNCTARRQRKLVVLCEVNIAVADYFAKVVIYNVVDIATKTKRGKVACGIAIPNVIIFSLGCKTNIMADCVGNWDCSGGSAFDNQDLCAIQL